MFIKNELKDDLCIISVDREEALNAMNTTVLHEEQLYSLHLMLLLYLHLLYIDHLLIHF